MAPGTLSVQNTTEILSQASERISVKTLVESPAGLTSIPSRYSYSSNPNESAGSDPDDMFPIIDFSLLTSGDHNRRSKVIQDLDKACREWGFFLLVNHGVSENLMKEVLDGCNDFFNLSMEEKMEYDQGKDIWKPIRFGTSVDSKVQKFSFWRDFFKAYVHPQFNFPNKPKGFSDIGQEYCKRVREVTLELLKGISQSLGFDEFYVKTAMNLDSGCQIFAANLYPVCPQPELAMGIPSHTDHGLLTLLIANEIGGLQIQHKGEWFNVNPLPNSFVVNTGDHLEILSNGRYKSVIHRAVVNNTATRISIASPFGPSLDTVISPAPELLESERCLPSAYMPMTYKDYMDRQVQEGKSGLDIVRLQLA